MKRKQLHCWVFLQTRQLDWCCGCDVRRSALLGLEIALMKCMSWEGP
jgi:hypothetical protein